jgi:hypothetical protein
MCSFEHSDCFKDSKNSEIVLSFRFEKVPYFDILTVKIVLEDEKTKINPRIANNFINMVFVMYSVISLSVLAKIF